MSGASVIDLPVWRVAISALLILAAGVVSLGLKLGVERRLAVAATRMVVQLTLVGFVLERVFATENPWAVLAILISMSGTAAWAAISRSSRRYRGARLDAFVTLVLTGLATTLTVSTAVVGVEPWFRAQYVIPLMGMMLGNALTGISIALDSILSGAEVKRDRIETELALGATRWEAMREPVRDATRRGLIPILNAMSVVGIVSLPGMMTGQILAGASPIIAVKYQIVVMFMIATSTSVGAMALTLLSFVRITNDRHQLRTERLLRK